ncbi:hypothetical protein CRM22_010419 [Opisthorchis felineus]|uniref:Uncharacterized protein n=1 Tax=Opisthorchis felineus TaxID=147828 RepID=A0A4S2KZ01_OPIFE|nr:hypothetical protein CRM22_010419 [Opisthorchis felineus]
MTTTDDRRNVILEQPRASGNPYRAWNDGLWDCGNNYTNSFLTAFCYTCMTCYLYEKYGEGCLTPCIIPMSAMVLTVQHRNRNGIRSIVVWLENAALFNTWKHDNFAHLGHQTR